MSALTWDEVGVVESTPRRHLTLVPTGDEFAASGLQLTRRGRLAITLVVLALAVIAAVVGVNRAFAAPAAAAPLATVTVASGDTLSAIAAREMPGLPIREAVQRLQIANNLNSAAISAGASIVIPSY